MSAWSTASTSSRRADAGRRRIAAIVLASAALSLGTAACVPAPLPRPPTGGSGAPAPATECLQAEERTVLAEMNRLRREAGLPPYALDVRLVRAARTHARDMAGRDFLDHVGSDGSRPAERVRREGFPWTVVAENIAAGRRSARATVGSWMESPGHRSNILWDRAEATGVARAERDGTVYGVYWVVTFGTAADGVVPPAGCS